MSNKRFVLTRGWYRLWATERHIIRILLVLLLIAASSSIANAAPVPKFEFLLRFFDLNEAASAYQRHCGNPGSKVDKTFLDTMKFITDELSAQDIKENPGLETKFIQSKILERRDNLQYRLDSANIKEGCGSKDSAMAKAHYEEFSRFDREQINQFIDAQTQH